MKTLKTIVFTLILSTTTILAQSMDKWSYSELDQKIMTTDNDKIYLNQQLEITKEITPFMLDPKDKYKLNQDIIWLPVQVTKKIKLDYDIDSSFEKSVVFNYLKPDTVDLEFTFTKKGIKINTYSKTTKIKKIIDIQSLKSIRKIKNEGNYTIMLSNNEKIILKVTNYNRMK